MGNTDLRSGTGAEASGGIIAGRISKGPDHVVPKDSTALDQESPQCPSISLQGDCMILCIKRHTWMGTKFDHEYNYGSNMLPQICVHGPNSHRSHMHACLGNGCKLRIVLSTYYYRFHLDCMYTYLW